MMASKSLSAHEILLLERTPKDLCQLLERVLCSNVLTNDQVSLIIASVCERRRLQTNGYGPRRIASPCSNVSPRQPPALASTNPGRSSVSDPIEVEWLRLCDQCPDVDGSSKIRQIRKLRKGVYCIGGLGKEWQVQATMRSGNLFFEVLDAKPSKVSGSASAQRSSSSGRKRPKYVSAATLVREMLLVCPPSTMQETEQRKDEDTKVPALPSTTESGFWPLHEDVQASAEGENAGDASPRLTLPRPVHASTAMCSSDAPSHQTASQSAASHQTASQSVKHEATSPPEQTHVIEQAESAAESAAPKQAPRPEKTHPVLFPEDYNLLYSPPQIEDNTPKQQTTTPTGKERQAHLDNLAAQAQRAAVKGEASEQYSAPQREDDTPKQQQSTPPCSRSGSEAMQMPVACQDITGETSLPEDSDLANNRTTEHRGSLPSSSEHRGSLTSDSVFVKTNRMSFLDTDGVAFTKRGSVVEPALSTPRFSAFIEPVLKESKRRESKS